MIMYFFTVYDKKVGAFMPPFQMRSRGEAIRSFMDAVNDEAHQFHKHAGDYELFQCGAFDDVEGVMSAKLEPVISALACMRKSSDT